MELSFHGNNAWWNYWDLSGNSGTNSANNYIGTNDNQPLIFKVNSLSAGYIGLRWRFLCHFTWCGFIGGINCVQSTAIGAGAQATGSNASLAVGYNAIASAQDAIAIGESAVSSTNNEAIAIGRTSATSFQGIAIGATAKSPQITRLSQLVMVQQRPASSQQHWAMEQARWRKLYCHWKRRNFCSNQFAHIGQFVGKSWHFDEHSNDAAGCKRNYQYCEASGSNGVLQFTNNSTEILSHYNPALQQLRMR